MSNAISLQGLTKSYPDFTLGPLTLDLPTGCILGLVGENGAGKTTTLRLLLGTLDADGGQAIVLDTDSHSKAFTQTKHDIGVVLDSAYFPETMTPKQVGKTMSMTYRNWEKDTYESYLKRFDLPPEKPFKDFSRGMKMKLSIAVALSHRAKLLVLDEATGGLDPMARDEILDIFNDFTRDPSHTVLMSSHIVSDLEKICDYIAFLHKGKLLLMEEKDVLLEEFGLLSLSKEDAEALSPEAIVGAKENPYGLKLLVKKNLIPAGFQTERATLEEIILFLAKGGAQ